MNNELVDVKGNWTKSNLSSKSVGRSKENLLDVTDVVYVSDAVIEGAYFNKVIFNTTTKYNFKATT